MFSLDDASKYGKDAMDNMLKSYSALAQGMQTMTTEAADFSKKSYEDNAKAMEQLVAAKSFEKAFEIQSDFAKSSYESFVAQATKMSEIYSNAARDAYKPLEAAATKAAPAAAPKKAA
ncbi:MAG: phasin family protein [Alphaproteobacteria bacterium]|nr:phasin family protein [Alphaproteobacteria bacterium]